MHVVLHLVEAGKECFMTLIFILDQICLKSNTLKKKSRKQFNHFHEKLLKLKDLMKKKAGHRRAERRHKFVEHFLKEFYEEWDGRAQVRLLFITLHPKFYPGLTLGFISAQIL